MNVNTNVQNEYTLFSEQQTRDSEVTRSTVLTRFYCKESWPSFPTHLQFLLNIVKYCIHAAWPELHDEPKAIHVSRAQPGTWACFYGLLPTVYQYMIANFGYPASFGQEEREVDYWSSLFKRNVDLLRLKSKKQWYLFYVLAGCWVMCACQTVYLITQFCLSPSRMVCIPSLS